MCGDGCVYIDEETIIRCYRQIQIASPLTDRFFCWTGEAAHEQKLYFKFSLTPNTDNSACSIYAHSFHETN